MVRIKPFRGIRPPKEHAAEVASRPYDVLDSAEAKAEASERSLLHIIKPEIDFDPIADEHAEEVYDRAVENFRLWRERGWLQQDEEEHYYVYAQTMDGRTQYGLAMCCHFEDYRSGAIKKHELTRPDKEEDRMKHVRCQRANIEPVFFAYPDNAEIDALVEGVVKGAAPDYDFTAEDGFGHRLWVIRDRKVNDRITEIFKDIPALYVADGHHRTAAAARVGEECMLRNPNHRGDEEYCFFLAVTFPASQLRIIDYNRVVRDLNGMTPAEFVEALRTDFEVEKIGGEVYRPARLHNFAMYLDGAWYSLTAREGTYDDRAVEPCAGQAVGYKGSAYLETDRFRGRYPRIGRVAAACGQRRDEGRLRTLPRFDETADRHRRYGQHHAAQDDVVRTQTAFGRGDPFLRGGKIERRRAIRRFRKEVDKGV